jgi:hypothetical protein
MIEMAGSMSEHLSPVMEGFENPTMATVFQEMLKITPVKNSRGRGPKSAITASASSSGSCPPSSTSASSTSSATPSGSSTSEKIAFLKTIITEQRSTADSLMDSAKKMGPVAQKLSAQKGAYDAAFESDLVAPMPNTSGTLQGFTLVFFTLALFSLAIVSSILAGNAVSGVATFGGFTIAYVVSLALISRYG